VFIPIAEETGLIVGIGDWVLGEACRQTAEWQTLLGDQGFTLSVNLSVHQLEPLFVQRVADIISVTGIAAPSLVLEVTESVFMDDERTDPALLQHLRGLGPQVFLDDFGTGYSSLSYLQRFPVDGLKIDRSFVTGLDADGSGVLAEAVLRIAESLDLSVIAEGIEHPRQRTALLDLGCRLGQGFGLLRPMPADKLTRLLTERTREIATV
jgi:EAL domain-containing protein (putative c-di-GMP-specific phosphodiesterase class I)